MSVNVLTILVRILNIGIDYEYKRGNLDQTANKIQARNKILAQITARLNK